MSDLGPYVVEHYGFDDGPAPEPTARTTTRSPRATSSARRRLAAALAGAVVALGAVGAGATAAMAADAPEGGPAHGHHAGGR